MWSSEGEPIIELAVTLEGSGAASTGTPFNVTPVKQLHAVVMTADGEIVDEIHQEVQLPARSATAPGPAVPRPFVHVHDWALDPGSYDLRVAVHDETSTEISATQLDLTVPEPTSDWQTSDLMLTVTDDGRPAQPLVDDEMRAGERLDVYVEVFGGEQPSILGDVLSGDGARVLVQFPRTDLVRDAAGIHRGAVFLTGVPAGEYVLQISVLDPPAGEQRGFRIPLRATGVGSARD